MFARIFDMKENKSGFILPQILVLLSFCITAYSSEPQDQSNYFQFLANDARTSGGTRLFENPERIGFPKLHAQAEWSLVNVTPGTYDIDLTYSAGSSEKDKFLGTVEVKIGSRTREVNIRSTGHWGNLGIITLDGIRISEDNQLLSVRVINRKHDVQTVLDLWYIEFEITNTKIRDAGKIRRMDARHGDYIQYIPRSADRTSEVLVLIHGTPGRDETAIDCAEKFLTDFISTAKDKKVILLAPVFDTKNFGGHKGPGGGYRGLFGREISADKFVIEILSKYKRYLKPNDKIYVYGHSAGGQFISRFIVMHSDRIAAAVISAAGTYAFPNPNIKWPDGMARLQREFEWDGDKRTQKIDVSPNPDGWVKSATLPITVIVGKLDDTKVPETEGQLGESMVERASLWVQSMNELAEEHGQTGTVNLVLVDEVGHTSSQLSPLAITRLFQDM